MSAKQFEAGSRDGERLLFAVGDWFRWANPMGIGGVTVFGRIANVDLFECGAAASIILRIEPHPELRNISHGRDVFQQPGLSGNGGALFATGHHILKEIYAGRFSKVPLVTGANVGTGGNGTLLTFTDANGVVCAVVLGPSLPEGLARQLAHVAAYPWENQTPLIMHCPRHSTRRIGAGATCDTCLAEIESRDSASDGIRFGARVKVTRRKERDNGYDAAARAVRESHDGQVGTAEDYPPMTCVWLVRFSDGSRVGYNVDELTFVPGPAASLAESGVTT